MAGVSSFPAAWRDSSNTVVTGRCPAQIWTCFVVAPWAIHSETAVWRRSCVRRPTSPGVRLQASGSGPGNEPARIGAPSDPVKTKASTPAFRRHVGHGVGEGEDLVGVDSELAESATAVRAAHRSWSEIGAVLGVSKQAAQRKNGTKTPA